MRSSPDSPSSHDQIFQALDGLVQHWRNTFPDNFPRSTLQKAIQSIIENRPIPLTFSPPDELTPPRTMTPLIALPEARSYFQHKLALGQILLPQHYNLLPDVFTVLAQDSALPLLQQLLLIEFNDVIAHALNERPDWILHSLQPDGWIDLTEEVLFQAGNCALLGLLTLILTLPWELELKILLEKDVASQPS